MKVCCNTRMSVESFGQYLRKLRKANKKTLREVAAGSGVSYTYLCNIEAGNRGIPSPELIRALSVYFGVTHIGMMIKAGYITLEEVLVCREEHGLIEH